MRIDEQIASVELVFHIQIQRVLRRRGKYEDNDGGWVERVTLWGLVAVDDNAALTTEERLSRDKQG